MEINVKYTIADSTDEVNLTAKELRALYERIGKIIKNLPEEEIEKGKE